MLDGSSKRHCVGLNLHRSLLYAYILIMMWLSVVTAFQYSSKRNILQATTDAVTVNPTAIDRMSLFTAAWNQSLFGNIGDIQNMLSQDAVWDNPLHSNRNEFLEQMKDNAAYFLEPALTVYNSAALDQHTYQMEYQLSFTFPMPWRPRVIVPARAVVQFSSTDKVISVHEKWDISLSDIVLGQFLPRFWDIWHAFSTPSSEFPPMKRIKTIGKVDLFEIPATMTCDLEWNGLAKYPGPPLAVIPSFCLFGDLKTSKPNRDRFLTVLPVEVRSGKYLNGEEKCQDVNGSPITWQDFSYKYLSESSSDVWMEDDVKETVSVTTEGEEPTVKPDFVRDALPSDISSRLKGLARTPESEYDLDALIEFEKYESKSFRYRLQPKRLIASTDIRGEVTPEKIASALKTIRSTVQSNAMKFIDGSRLDLVDGENTSDAQSSGFGLDLGLQLWFSKICFNMKAEPSMAIYEMQYDYRKTRVFLEAILISK